MPDLVPLEFVKKALRVAHDDDDDVLEMHIASVTEAVLRYLRRLDVNEWTSGTVPNAVRSAILLGVKSLYDEDKAELLSGLASSDPKNPLVALLCMMRRPTVA